MLPLTQLFLPYTCLSHSCSFPMRASDTVVSSPCLPLTQSPCVPGARVWVESEVQGRQVHHWAGSHDKGQRLGLAAPRAPRPTPSFPARLLYVGAAWPAAARLSSPSLPQAYGSPPGILYIMIVASSETLHSSLVAGSRVAYVEVWGSFQYKDRPSMFRYFHYKDETVSRLSYLYNGNSCTGKMASLYWGSTQLARSRCVADVEAWSPGHVWLTLRPQPS